MEKMEETVKKTITSLLVSTPMVMKMEQLAKDYRNMIGEPLPYSKLGYNSLEHFLRSISDTVVVNGGGPFAEVIPVIKDKSAHINQLVAKQRISLPKKKKSNNSSYVPKRKMYYPQPPRTSSFKVAGNAPGNTFMQHRNVNPNFDNQILKLLNNVTISNFPLNPPTYPPINFNRNLETRNEQNFNLNNKSNYNVPETRNVQKNYTRRNTFNNDVGGTRNVSDLNIRNTPNPNMDVKKSSNPGKVDIRNKSNDEVSPENDRWNSINLARVKKALMEKHKPKINDSDTGVPLDIQNNLKKLIEKHPEGIWCAKLPQLYQQMFYKDLKYEMLGFTTLSQLCTSLSSIFHFVRPEKGDFKLYDRNKPLPKNVEKYFTVASYSKKNDSEGASSNALPKIEWEDVINFLPEGTFKPGQEIPRSFISAETKVNDDIDIVVGEIYDLSKFWVHLNDGLLDKLMDDMQVFYGNHANEYLMPDSLIRVGIYCVHVIFGEYHRALIVDTLPEVEGSIKVIFFDYGTMTKVSTEGLCFLHSNFAHLEVQSIRCRLANICPPEEGSPWNVAASKAFRSMVLQRTLCAKITHINREELFIEIYIADVTDKQNIYYINDRLVEEGHAQYPDKDLKKSTVHTICTPIVKYLHLFPTFLELEYGVVPSASEMEVLAECNVPLNFCYPQYFSTDQTDEIKRIKHVEEFYSSYLKGKRNNASHYIDLTKFKTVELDTSIFKDLESEIVESLNETNFSDYNTEDSLSELVDAVPNKECNVATIFRQLNELKTQTVLELHRDYELSNEIINDIDMLCSGNDVSNLENRLLWSRNENFNSASAIVNSDQISDREGGEDFFDVHPLSKMSFDEKHSAHSSDCELEDEDVNSKVLDECFDHGSIVEEEHYLLERPPSNASNSESTGRITNPFLENLDELERSVGVEEVSVVSTLNPNNPFLKFLTGDDLPEFSPSDDVSDKSSTSTVYESCVHELSIKKTWSTHENNSNDVSVTEAVSCYSSSSDSVKRSRTVGSCAMSTQTSEEGSGGSQMFQQQSFPPPLSIPTVQPYSNWSTGYGPYVGAFDPRYTGANNPYPQADYNMLQQMYRYNYGAAAFPNTAMEMMNRPMQGLSTQMQNRPMGMQNGPMSMQNGPMSMQNGPMSMQNGPMSMQNGPMSMQNGPMGMQNSSMGMQNGPMMRQGGPMPNPPMGFQVVQGPSQVSRICPPPGFAPNSNVYQRESVNFTNLQQQPRIPMCPPQRATAPPQVLGTPLQYSPGLVSSTPCSSSMMLGSEKDFYESYNEKLLLKTQVKKD